MVARLLDGGADIEEKDGVSTQAHGQTQTNTGTHRDTGTRAEAHGRSKARTDATHDSTHTVWMDFPYVGCPLWSSSIETQGTQVEGGNLW
jgi:hypothetical protein